MGTEAKAKHKSAPGRWVIPFPERDESSTQEQAAAQAQHDARDANGLPVAKSEARPEKRKMRSPPV